MRISDEALKTVVYIGGLIAPEPIPAILKSSGPASLFCTILFPTTANAPFYTIMARHVIDDIRSTLGAVPLAGSRRC